MKVEKDLQYYMVGGAIRDKFLGRKTHDTDWCVVGAKEQDMLNMGFSKVPALFPVFIHQWFCNPSNRFSVF